MCVHRRISFRTVGDVEADSPYRGEMSPQATKRVGIAVPYMIFAIFPETGAARAARIFPFFFSEIVDKLPTFV